jgi:hypothetical protein
MSRARKIMIGLTLLLCVGLALAWRGWYLPTRDAVAIGAGLLAKQVCSCVYVAGRELDDCRADQMASTDPIQLEVRASEQRVRAWLPAFAERSAIHRAGFGCTLE